MLKQWRHKMRVLNEKANVESCFTRCFATEDGRKVLAYLQSMTFDRALGPDASDNELRYMEGQRAMIASILRYIDRGRHR